jgi:hypothetical protein
MMRTRGKKKTDPTWNTPPWNTLGGNSDPTGASPWNTLGGNSENFIRPQTRRPVCTLYSPRSENGQVTKERERASAMHRNRQQENDSKGDGSSQ